MTDIEVYLDLYGQTKRVGTLYRASGTGRESVSFEYHSDWLTNPKRFSLEPSLKVGKGRFYPDQNREMFGTLGDSAPDTWGRELMRRAERRKAAYENRAPKTLHESDYLIGVSDLSRLGAIRFRHPDNSEYLAPTRDGVPGLVHLTQLLQSAERIERGDESDEDLQMIFAPGSSLGGARPKASVIDGAGRLSIAKFPKQTDSYCIESWESIALTLANRAGIQCADHQLIHVSDKPVLLSRRFDRNHQGRVPFLSAMSLLQLKDGDRASYPDIIDSLARVGGDVKQDAPELFRRMVFNILISNVDDHLRNHGLLMDHAGGWRLSPTYDLNPTPTDLRARILTTSISLDDAACSIPLALEQAPFFNLPAYEAKQIVAEVGRAAAQWRSVAARTGQAPREIERMASAFEHQDLEIALQINA